MISILIITKHIILVASFVITHRLSTPTRYAALSELLCQLGLLFDVRPCNLSSKTWCTHWRQSRQSTKPATKATVDFVAGLSPIVSTLSPVCRKSTVATSFDFVNLVVVDIVAKVEHVQLGRLCRKSAIFVARMSNVLSTLSPVCTGLKFQRCAVFKRLTLLYFIIVSKRGAY